MGEIEYIGSEPSPPKTYPSVLRFRVVVEGQPEKDRPGAKPSTGSLVRTLMAALEEKTITTIPGPRLEYSSTSPAFLIARAPGFLLLKFKAGKLV